MNTEYHITENLEVLGLRIDTSKQYNTHPFMFLESLNVIDICSTAFMPCILGSMNYSSATSINAIRRMNANLLIVDN